MWEPVNHKTHLMYCNVISVTFIFSFRASQSLQAGNCCKSLCTNVQRKFIIRCMAFLRIILQIWSKVNRNLSWSTWNSHYALCNTLRSGNSTGHLYWHKSVRLQWAYIVSIRLQWAYISERSKSEAFLTDLMLRGTAVLLSHRTYKFIFTSHLFTSGIIYMQSWLLPVVLHLL